MTFQARMSGKVVTVLQLLTLVAVLVAAAWRPWLVALVGVASVLSIADYTLALWRAARAVSALPPRSAGRASMASSPPRPTGARSSRASRLVPEVRIDVIGASRRGAGSRRRGDPGGSMCESACWPARARPTGMAHDGATAPAGSVDVLARFLLDPFRSRRWGFSPAA